MQIYLTCPSGEAEAVALVQKAFARYQLEELYTIEVLAAPEPVAQRAGGSAKMSMVTVLVVALGTGGAVTVGMSEGGAITRIAKALENLSNQQVEVKITEKNRTVEMSGSAGHIEKMLKDLHSQNR
ncbi:hypothetical protein [Methylovulum psychrotolerans]|uniref:Uncharacterized protein n=1 Tax=Methylovulum psychrotolerans TaxID=1704499 RepID=A0A1Z4C0U2_9GAMM|nr:hypothetical protein [Methylovulum psychrotolerans]ASF47158.1 hypothetical protein CEK71_14380 [Methylovulum psychrotolerans]MBT9097213.1 hypothetical protein [Methylovulum psychrotolerans]